MIEKLVIRGFRGFQEFEAHDLGRVNLLVGANNCGKTTVLEAVQLLESVGDATSLWQISSRRGERLFDTTESPVYSSEVDICHLFHGHEIALGASLQIEGYSKDLRKTFTATIVESREEESLFEEHAIDGSDDVSSGPTLAIELKWTGATSWSRQLPLSARGGIPVRIIRRYERLKQDESNNIKFISTAGLTIDDVVKMFEEIVLTREEELVTKALSTIEPDIDRIATLSSDTRRSRPGERGGIVVRTTGSARRLPIGSMGDGMWRMLGLAVSIVAAQKGTLLVDEIDTGLHFSVLENVWKLIDTSTKRLAVQVFATSHSRDAYESLAAIAHPKKSANQITIQRIERTKKRSVAYSEQEIIASATRGTEVR